MRVRDSQAPARKIRGVTLVELLVGLIIISIGMTIAIPSFNGMVARNRVATQVNEMLLSINLARSEAGSNGSRVTIQAQAADTADEFGAGWCIVAGNPGDCESNVIRVFPALIGEATLNLVDDGGDDFIEFSSTGGMKDDSSISIDLCYAGQQGRRIFISPIGRSKSHSPTDLDQNKRPCSCTDPQPEGCS